jgi:H+/gluconate symporter-like permease
MSLLIVLGALIFLMFVAYRGYSVILFAPIAALGAVLLTDPSLVPPLFSSVFMEKMVGFVKNYFPVFMLGAVFGKVIELSGFSKSIVAAVIGVLGRERAVPSIVVVCAILTYGGVSLFVVVFAVYPFAAEMFRQGDIPKRLIPCTIALGAFSFTMDALPGTPQIQNIIPTTFFNTTTWAAPVLGLVASVFVFGVGLAYIENRRRAAQKRGEGYGTELLNEPEPFEEKELPNPWIAMLPLVVVGVTNLILTFLVPRAYGAKHEVVLGGHTIVTQIGHMGSRGRPAPWYSDSVRLRWRPVLAKFADGSKAAVAGALLASLNTASEYGFGGVIALLPGFAAVSAALRAIPNPLVNEAVTVTVLAGITGSASGGMSIALAAMSEEFIAAAKAANIPLEVFHRIAAMSSGGMDTMPHNGAVITLLAVTGLTHRQAYKDVFVITMTKTAAVFVAIAFFYLTRIY